jgi:DNA-binding NarL/FixJ family response regulator
MTAASLNPRAVSLQTRVLLVEDHKPFLDFVSSLLRENFNIIGKIQDGLAAVQSAGELQPDLILLDIGLPGINGIEAARRIRTLAPNAKIVFVTQESAADLVEAAFHLGAWGYVIKSHAARDLHLAIHAVMSGNRFVSECLDHHATLNES